jgi:hypothetical protein
LFRTPDYRLTPSQWGVELTLRSSVILFAVIPVIALSKALNCLLCC